MHYVRNWEKLLVGMVIKEDCLTFFCPYRTSRFLDWKSVQFEQDTSSLYVCEAGNHASKSYFLAAASFNAPETMDTTRYGSFNCLININQ